MLYTQQRYFYYYGRVNKFNIIVEKYNTIFITNKAVKICHIDYKEDKVSKCQVMK